MIAKSNIYKLTISKTRTVDRKMITQKLLGVAILALCAVIMLMAAQGQSLEERDATPVLFLAPLGIALIVSKKYIIND